MTLKAGGSSTKSSISHLKSKHSINVKRCHEVGNEDDQPKSKVPRIDAYLRTKRRPPQKRRPFLRLLLDLVSVDGLTFNQIANSSLMRRAFTTDGNSLTKSFFFCSFCNSQLKQDKFVHFAVTTIQ